MRIFLVRRRNCLAMERERAIAAFFFFSSSSQPLLVETLVFPVPLPVETLVFPVKFNLTFFTAVDDDDITGGALKVVDKFPSDEDSLVDADPSDDDDDDDDADESSGWDLHGDRQSTELEIG